MKITAINQPFDYAQGGRRQKITDIRPQVKRADRFSIFIEGKYVFSFSQDEILHLGLKIGQEFSKQELEQLKKSAVQDKAYDRALNLIARRPRSAWEIRTYLEKKLLHHNTPIYKDNPRKYGKDVIAYGVDDGVGGNDGVSGIDGVNGIDGVGGAGVIGETDKDQLIEKILNKLSDVGYVDDIKFAGAWVRSRRLLKPTSKRRLRQELRQKRVSDEIIEDVLEQDEADDKEILHGVVERKRKRYPDKLKFMQYLSRQGYNYDDIKAVLDDIKS